MVAGSETGAIIAASLAIKNGSTSTPANNASKAFEFFRDHVDNIYVDN